MKMAPVKFDDIAKVATEVLNDDYQVNGHTFKAKQGTRFHGATVTTAINLAKEGCVTPATLTWKLPKPFGCPVICVDKLEVDKAGKMKLEVSSEKAKKGLKLDCKSDLSDLSKVTASAQYSAIKDTQFKFETTVLKPDNFNFEITRTQGPAQFGLKCSAANMTAPDLGIRFEQGPLFISLFAKDKFSTFAAHTCYKVNDVLKVAGMLEQGNKGPSFSFGVLYDVIKGTKLRVKMQHDQSVSVGVKHEVAKGFNLLGGSKFDTAKGGLSYGVQISLE